MVETVTVTGHPSSGTVRVCVYAHVCDGCAFDVCLFACIIYMYVVRMCSVHFACTLYIRTYM